MHRKLELKIDILKEPRSDNPSIFCCCCCCISHCALNALTQMFSKAQWLTMTSVAQCSHPITGNWTFTGSQTWASLTSALLCFALVCTEGRCKCEWHLQWALHATLQGLDDRTSAINYSNRIHNWRYKQIGFLCSGVNQCQLRNSPLLRLSTRLYKKIFFSFLSPSKSVHSLIHSERHTDNL